MRRLIFDEEGKYDGAWDCASKVFESEGLAGFYDGMLFQLVGGLSLAAIALFAMPSEANDDEEKKITDKKE